MRPGRQKRITRIEPVSVPLHPPYTPHDLTWNRTWTAAITRLRCGMALLGSTLGWGAANEGIKPQSSYDTFFPNFSNPSFINHLTIHVLN
jgi:hypothetical protein